jgi:aminoglycoside/choline kinase family phosphotransferase
MTATENALHQWTLQQIHQHAKIHSELITLTPMSGDAGFRQYFRVNTQPSLLAVMAPKTPGNSDSAAYFAGLSRLLRDQGIPTPQIVA